MGKWMVLLSLLICIVNGVCSLIPPVVVASDVSVDCGAQSGSMEPLTFGPVNITVVANDLVDVRNYTVYAFSSDDPSCVFTGFLANSTRDPNSIYTRVYEYIWPSQTLGIGTLGQCGMDRKNASTIQMKIVVVEGTLLTDEDKAFVIECVYNPAGTGPISTVNIDNDIVPPDGDIRATAKPNPLDRTYQLHLIESATASPILSPVNIGTSVNLRVLASGEDDGKNGAAGDENGIRVGLCTAQNDDNSQHVTIVKDYCRDLSSEINWVPISPEPKDQVGFTSTFLQSYSPPFEMFAITGGTRRNIVTFTCDVDVCRTRANCDGDNCPVKRRKRELLYNVGAAEYRNSNIEEGHVRISTYVMVHYIDSKPANTAGVKCGSFGMQLVVGLFLGMLF
ncbi:unnamed protein product [Owenia fusiformis]|uniref:Uncharacterized protein n=1 Tax=Owenia fusiformis TaxID=6347 RepID=A0A8J1TE81_OWEFU|nr:unnamed protein product [Owenia fusiformis]